MTIPKKIFFWFVVLLAMSSGASSARAEVSREGTWPERDPKVTLSLENISRPDAIKKLAEKADWSVVVELPPSAPVDVHVKDQPATKVLEILLADGRYVAKRDGDLISISKAPDSVSPAIVPDAGPAASDAEAPVVVPAPADAAAPAAEPPPAAKPATRKGEDRVVTGGSTRIEAHEVVHDLVVMGGSAEVLGTVTGDMTVMGGSATLRKGARVEGDAAVVGGSLDVEEGATLDGDVGVVGGKVRRGDKAVSLSLSDVDEQAKKATRGFMGLLSDIGGAITRSALLFVFGAVLLALATGRMESMQGEVAARPMRTFALGVVGAIVFIVSVIALCVTIVGIPIALLALAVMVFGAYSGICAVLTTTGGALVHHKTKSPYAHLAVGCALFLVLGNLPWIGGFVTLAVVVVGMGALFATRGAGFFGRRERNEGPYRTAHP